MSSASDCFVFETLRTPRGKASPRGGLAQIPPVRLLASLQKALAERAPCAATHAEDVIIGCVTQVDGQGANIARTASLLAGYKPSVMGMTVSRFCTSGLDAIGLAAARVQGQGSHLMVAGGVESVSQVPVFSDRGPLYGDPEVAAALHTVHMGIAADLVATLENIDRAQIDAYAFATRAKAQVAWKNGRGHACVVPAGGLSHDEYLGFVPTATELAAMPPAFAEMGQAGQDAIVLARFPHLGRVAHLHSKATSPPPADGAALVLLGDAQAARTHGLSPRARIAGYTTAACDPVLMLTAGQTAIESLLQRHGLRAEDVAVFEFAEAFAALCVKLQRDLHIEDARLNIYGGTLAVGHALGATGAVLVGNVVQALHERQSRFGVAAISGAAGVGCALLIERV